MIAGLIAGGIVVSALLTLAIYAITSTRRAGDEKAGRAEFAARNESLTAQVADLASRLKDEKERADALDDLIAELAVAGPVDGAYDRLLQKWATSKPGGGARVVPPPASPAGPGPDDLLPLE